MELELKGITKRFGSLVANDRIDLSVAPGQVHALLGENGAGKTTLMNVLYGLLQPDEGEILIDGKAVQFHSPGDAIAAGIGMVHQHFMLVPVFTVAENVTLGIEETRRSGLLDRRKTRQDVRELSRRYGLEVDPDALVENLPVGIQQRVEIVKALVREATVLILDEPTAVLTPAETEDLFRIIRQLKDGGRSIVFISHKLKEVQAIADTITVLRRGKVVGQRPPGTTEDELASLMVGRDVQLRVSKEAAKPGDVVLDVADLTVADETGRIWVNGMSFQVRAGEILGVAGVQGNGQTELCEALMGLRPAASGQVTLNGRDLTRATPRTAAARRHRLRPRGPAGRRAGRRVLGGRTTWCSTRMTGRRSPPASGSTWPPSRPTRPSACRNSTSAPPRRSDQCPRCPAATSRRSSWPGNSRASTSCSWPASPPAGLTWARSSSCTAASWTSATRAWPCSSSPPNSTRSTPSRTGSRSCTRARSPVSVRRRCRWKNSGC